MLNYCANYLKFKDFLFLIINKISREEFDSKCYIFISIKERFKIEDLNLSRDLTISEINAINKITIITFENFDIFEKKINNFFFKNFESDSELIEFKEIKIIGFFGFFNHFIQEALNYKSPNFSPSTTDCHFLNDFSIKKFNYLCWMMFNILNINKIGIYLGDSVENERNKNALPQQQVWEEKSESNDDKELIDKTGFYNKKKKINKNCIFNRAIYTRMIELKTVVSKWMKTL